MGVSGSAANQHTWSDMIFGTYKHDDKNSKLNVTIEEAYIAKKQLSLNIHFVSCGKIKQRFEPLIMATTRGDLSQQEFCTQLAKLKLLKDDYPQTDERWVRFYSKFVVFEEKAAEPRFSLLHALIALFYLSQSPADVKA